MKVILQRVWKEPAVAIGLAASLILLILQFIGDNEFTADTIIAICAPFVSALGIRQAVTPAAVTTSAPEPEIVTPAGEPEQPVTPAGGTPEQPLAPTPIGTRPLGEVPEPPPPKEP